MSEHKHKMIMTEDTYIGQIPIDWQMGKYKYFAKSGMGLTILKTDTTSTGVPIYSATQDSSIFGYIESPSLLLHYGDIVIPARGNSIGCPTFIQDENATCTQTTIYSKVHDIEPKYLYYCCIGLKEFWFFYIQTAIPQITVTQVQNNKIPLPPLSEQKAISNYLDEKCSKIDEIIAEATASIKEYKELKQAIIFEAVTKGLDKNVPMKDSGVEWVGEVPSHWTLQRITTIYEESKETGRDDLPILLVSIHTGISDREIDDDERDRKVIRSEDKTIYKVVHRNYLDYNMMRAWQGGFGASSVDGLVSPAYVVAKPKVKINSAYVENVLRTPNAIENIRGLSYGVAEFRLRLYWPYFKNIRIPVPPVEEQNAIVNYINIQSEQIDALISEKQSLIEDLQAYKKSLIYEVVTGKRRVV